MNGKGLMLLSKEMFCDRVPEGGRLIYEDFHLKLQKIVSEQWRKMNEIDSLLRVGLLNQ